MVVMVDLGEVAQLRRGQFLLYRQEPHLARSRAQPGEAVGQAAEHQRSGPAVSAPPTRHGALSACPSTRSAARPPAVPAGRQPAGQPAKRRPASSGHASPPPVRPRLPDRRAVSISARRRIPPLGRQHGLDMVTDHWCSLEVGWFANVVAWFKPGAEGARRTSAQATDSGDCATDPRGLGYRSRDQGTWYAPLLPGAQLVHLGTPPP